MYNKEHSTKINCDSDKKYIMNIGGPVSEKYLGHQELYEDPVRAVKVDGATLHRKQHSEILQA